MDQGGSFKRLEYIRRIWQEPVFKEKRNFAIYRNSKEYLALTVLTVARAIFAHVQKEYIELGLAKETTRRSGDRAAE